MIAYLRVIVNPDDDAAFERSINNPPRGIGQKTIDVIREQLRPRIFLCGKLSSFIKLRIIMIFHLA